MSGLVLNWKDPATPSQKKSSDPGALLHLQHFTHSLSNRSPQLHKVLNHICLLTQQSFAMATGKEKASKKMRKALHAEARAVKMARKRTENNERHGKKVANRKIAEEAAAAADPTLRHLIDHVESIKQPKDSRGRMQAVPPPALFDLIHSFLKDYKYIKAAHGMRTDNQERPGHSYHLWTHRGEAYPSLMEIYDQWYNEHPEKVNEELYDAGQAKRAADKAAQKESKKANLSMQLGQEEPKKDAAEEDDTSEESDSEEESTSDSDSDSDSDSSSGSEHEDVMVIDMKSDPAVAAKLPAIVAPVNPLKRKASSFSSSSESSSDDSSSESENESKTKIVAPPTKKAKIATPPTESSSDESSSESESEDETKGVAPTPAKKAKIATPPADSSSSSSDSDGDSDSSSSSSSSSGVDVAKVAAVSVPVDTTKVAKLTAAGSSSSDSDSDSSSSSDSSDSSDDEDAQKTTKQVNSASRSASDSSATLVGDAAKEPAKQAAKDESSSSDSSSSDSDSSSDSSPDSSADEEEEATTGKPKKTSKPPKDILVYHESLSKTMMKKNPLAVGEEKRIEATTNNFKKLKKQHIAFSRIPQDIKVDEKFASNKYVPYDYANQAHEKLIITKGKGFTKAKNKGKKGSFRGGAIETDRVGAIKFDD